MQVYTTIYLAETIGSEHQDAEKPISDFETKHGQLEIKRATLERITMLEARDWFVDDFTPED